MEGMPPADRGSPPKKEANCIPAVFFRVNCNWQGLPTSQPLRNPHKPLLSKTKNPTLTA